MIQRDWLSVGRMCHKNHSCEPREIYCEKAEFPGCRVEEWSIANIAKSTVRYTNTPGVSSRDFYLPRFPNPLRATVLKLWRKSCWGRNWLIFCHFWELGNGFWVGVSMGISFLFKDVGFGVDFIRVTFNLWIISFVVYSKVIYHDIAVKNWCVNEGFLVDNIVYNNIYN